MKSISLLIFLLFLFGLSVNAQKTMHAIFFVDSKDPMIGEYCKHDLEKMQEFAFDLSDALGYLYLEYEYMDGDFTAENLQTLPAKLKNKTDDSSIIILYVSAHGQSDPSGGQFPIISFNKTPKVSIKHVHDELDKLPKRIMLTISDACNIRPPSPELSGFISDRGIMKSGMTTTYSKAEAERFIELFGGERKLSKIITSCPPNYYSFISPEGSVFTNNFIAAIKNFKGKLDDPNAMDNVMEDAANLTERDSRWMCHFESSYFDLKALTLGQRTCSPYRPYWYPR